MRDRYAIFALVLALFAYAGGPAMWLHYELEHGHGSKHGHARVQVAHHCHDGARAAKHARGGHSHATHRHGGCQGHGHTHAHADNNPVDDCESSSPSDDTHDHNCRVCDLLTGLAVTACHDATGLVATLSLGVETPLPPCDVLSQDLPLDRAPRGPPTFAVA